MKLIEIFYNKIEWTNKCSNDQIFEGIFNRNVNSKFTITSYDSIIICKISIMGVFKKYFNYKKYLYGCGFPSIILEGIAEDYQIIIEKTMKMKTI